MSATTTPSVTAVESFVGTVTTSCPLTDFGTALSDSANSDSQGLAGLVADNAALGAVLQNLVDVLDVSPQPADPLDAGIVVDAPRVDQNTVVDAPRVDQVAVQSQPVDPLDAGRVEYGVPAPTVVDAPRVDQNTVVDAPRVDQVAVQSQPADPLDAGRVEYDTPATSEPVVAATSEPVVLQAAPVIAAPVADSTATPVSETTIASVAPVSATAAIDVSTMFQSAADAVAAAVTVSPELMRGEAGEIRVQLKPDVLEGSQVVIAVDGRKMEVTFVPTVTPVADMLVSNQQTMQHHLTARIAGFDVSVAVAQTVATNVAVSVGSTQAAQAAVIRSRRTNGRA